MKLIIAIILFFTSIALHAQTESFDILTYRAPARWKKQVTNDTVSFSNVDNASGTWCQMALYKSIANTGVAEKDFSNEWKMLIKTTNYPGSVEPAPTTYVADGWTHSSGISKFQWNGKEAVVSLLNISGYGTMVSSIVSMNSTKYAADVDQFLRSVELKKPELKQPAQPSQQNQLATSTTTTTPNTSSAIKVTDVRGPQGISISTSNFDDGWVAQPFADYVKVTKQQVSVLLHYAIADEMRQASNMAVIMWNRLVQSRYRAANLNVFKNEMYTYNNIWFAEADATEVGTNKIYHVGIRVLVSNGVASCIEIISPSLAEFQQTFPDQAKIEAMVNYNKFAVSPSDIVGTWEASSSSGINYYNTVTGGYAGTNTASANSFTIRNNGSYSSEHKGAFGMTGSMTYYDQKYEGKYTLTNWDVTMTNRFKGRTDVFFCQYEAVRGGRVLVLQDKQYSGTNYRLVKVK